MNYFFIDETITVAQANALYTDLLYGLNNVDNLARWGGAFSPGYDATKSLAFQMELRTYFGLTIAQVNEFKKNWQRIFKE